MKEFGYSKAEKLKQKSEITLLFSKGKWKSSGKLRLVCATIPLSDPLEVVPNKVGVSVSKRFFKKAVDRNRVKRLLREVYRHHKPDFQKKFGSPIVAMIFWNHSQMPSTFQEVEEEFLTLCKVKTK